MAKRVERLALAEAGAKRLLWHHDVFDVTEEIEAPVAALAAHASQKAWLDSSQGMDSYLDTGDEVSRRVGSLWGGCEHAEGWTRHLHLGLSAHEADPLTEALAGKVTFQRR